MKKNHGQEMAIKVIERLEKYCDKEGNVTYGDIVEMLVALNLSISAWLSLKANIPAENILDGVLRSALEINKLANQNE
jgi:hypothetical protein